MYKNSVINIQFNIRFNTHNIAARFGCTIHYYPINIIHIWLSASLKIQYMSSKFSFIKQRYSHTFTKASKMLKF